MKCFYPNYKPSKFATQMESSSKIPQTKGSWAIVTMWYPISNQRRKPLVLIFLNEMNNLVWFLRQ
jgi:hypothetical protein